MTRLVPNHRDDVSRSGGGSWVSGVTVGGISVTDTDDMMDEGSTVVTVGSRLCEVSVTPDVTEGSGRTTVEFPGTLVGAGTSVLRLVEGTPSVVVTVSEEARLVV